MEELVNTTHGRRSMAPKNRKLLDRLEEDQRFQDLVLTLSEQLARKARACKHKVQAPSLMRSALAIELLLMCSMRRENLTRLEVGKSINKIGQKEDARWVIDLAGETVKNGQPLRYHLTPETSALLEEYLQDWRGQLCQAPTDWLFPNAQGACLDPRTIAKAIAEHSKQILGVSITPHQFRHISADNYLEANPDKLLLISEHLGHRDANTTRRYYARSKQKQASLEYQEHVVEARSTARVRLKPRKSKHPAPTSNQQKDFL